MGRLPPCDGVPGFKRGATCPMRCVLWRGPAARTARPPRPPLAQGRPVWSLRQSAAEPSHLLPPPAALRRRQRTLHATRGTVLCRQSKGGDRGNGTALRLPAIGGAGCACCKARGESLVRSGGGGGAGRRRGLVGRSSWGNWGCGVTGWQWVNCDSATVAGRMDRGARCMHDGARRGNRRAAQHGRAQARAQAGTQ